MSYLSFVLKHWALLVCLCGGGVYTEVSGTTGNLFLRRGLIESVLKIKHVFNYLILYKSLRQLCKGFWPLSLIDKEKNPNEDWLLAASYDGIIELWFN